MTEELDSRSNESGRSAKSEAAKLASDLWRDWAQESAGKGIEINFESANANKLLAMSNENKWLPLAESSIGIAVARQLSWDEVKKYNPQVAEKPRDLAVGKTLKLWHASTGEIDDGWVLDQASTADNQVFLCKEYQLEIESQSGPHNLICAMAGVSARHIETLGRKLAELPEHIVQDLAEHGYKIIAAPTIPDVLPTLATLSPRGWSNDATFYDSDGTHDNVRRLIIAPERVRAEDHFALFDRLDVPVHQLGHALDYLRNLSSSEAFQTAFQKDMNAIGDRRHYIYKYFSQKNGAGAQECFAALFGLVLTNPENLDDRSYFERNFPHSIAATKKIIQEHELNFAQR